MRLRALLALLVLLGMLPVQGGTQASSGRSDPVPMVLYLEDIGGAGVLSRSAPLANGSVVLGRNMTANFTLGSLSALPLGGLGPVLLNLSLVSLNVSGMELSGKLHLDYFGNGSLVKVLPFENYTTSTALQIEHATVADNSPFDHDYYAHVLRNGSLRLELARVDNMDGLLELLCGNGDNASSLSIPYGAPLRANAGPDRSTKVNRTVAFNASLSGSVDPAATAYLWNFGNGMTAAGELVETSYSRPGTFNVTLTLRWNGLEENDTAVVSVSDNLPPTANAGNDVTKRVGENYTFRGAGSDADGAIVSYNWTFGDGMVATGQNVTHSYGSPGNYTVVLTVRDDGGAEGMDNLTVHINHPPRITNITAARSVSGWLFTVVATDPDGTILRYNWTFGDGTNGTGAQITHSYAATGSYTARCRVTDEYGDSAESSLLINVTNNRPRINSLGLSGTTFSVNEPVRFRPVVSDPDDDELSFHWTFGDGVTATDRNPNHYYTRTGTYTVTLSVSDGVATETMTDSLTIEEGTAEGPALWGVMACIVVVAVVLILVVARVAAQARRRQETGGLYGAGQYQSTTGLPGGAGPFGAQYQPYQERYQPYGGPYQPAASPPRASRPPKAPPGVCPRCGSPNPQRFPDGHAKCQNCKKIFFTG